MVCHRSNPFLFPQCRMILISLTFDHFSPSERAKPVFSFNPVLWVFSRDIPSSKTRLRSNRKGGSLLQDSAQEQPSQRGVPSDSALEQSSESSGSAFFFLPIQPDSAGPARPNRTNQPGSAFSKILFPRMHFHYRKTHLFEGFF